MKRILGCAVASALLPISAACADYQQPGLVGPDGSLPVFHARLREGLRFSLGWTQSHSAQPQVWQAAALQKARELILLPDPAATPFDACVIDEVDRGSYVARKVEFNVSADSRVLALLLVPKGKGPFPAALMLHDHGARFDIGKEKMVRTWNHPAAVQSADQWSQRYFSGKFPGDELAGRGYVVMAVDALGWGDRTGPGFGRDTQQALASNLFLLGSSYAGLIATEDVQAARFLAAQAEVDSRHIAAIGFSMGAYRAWQLAALSEHISAGISVAWMATLQGLMVPGNNQLKGQTTYSMLHPHLTRYLDYPDVAALAAPKPMLFYAGQDDTMFPVPAVRDAFAKMDQVWTALRANEKLHTRIWPLGHVFSAEQQNAAFDWLDSQFGRKP